MMFVRFDLLVAALSLLHVHTWLTMPVLADLGFPPWLRAAHWINVFFIGYLMRSGIQILSSYPRLYWNDHTTPGTEWIKFTKNDPPKDKLWITLDQEVPVSPLIAQPGGKQLGLGRHWHFFSIIFWLLNGLVYVVLLFATGEWRRLIPTSWSIIPDAWHTFLTYATFHLPPDSAFHPYDPLQQLAYAAVVFLLGPFLILTGAAQSPALEAQFPWYVRLFGGRQFARSLHFLGLLAFIAFTIVHTALVIITGLGRNLGDIVLGQHQHDQGLAIILGILIVACILALYGITSWLSQRFPRAITHALAAIYGPFVRMMTLRSRSRQEYRPEDISPVFPVNGEPPTDPDYLKLLWEDFAGYHLEITGLVKHPLCLSLAEIKALPKQTQITKHDCIQGWSAIGEWGGVSLGQLLERCEPLPEARYLVFWSYSDDTSGRPFYETINLALARHPQTILAYEMNGQPVPMPHGAPLRLRVETQLGFKMVKWIRRIEVVERYDAIREGEGGSREDNKHYEQAAAI